MAHIRRQILHTRMDTLYSMLMILGQESYLYDIPITLHRRIFFTHRNMKYTLPQHRMSRFYTLKDLELMSLRLSRLMSFNERYLTHFRMHMTYHITHSWVEFLQSCRRTVLDFNSTLPVNLHMHLSPYTLYTHRDRALNKLHNCQRNPLISSLDQGLCYCNYLFRLSCQ